MLLCLTGSFIWLLREHFVPGTHEKIAITKESSGSTQAMNYL